MKDLIYTSKWFHALIAHYVTQRSKKPLKSTNNLFRKSSRIELKDIGGFNYWVFYDGDERIILSDWLKTTLKEAYELGLATNSNK